MFSTNSSEADSEVAQGKDKKFLLSKPGMDPAEQQLQDLGGGDLWGRGALVPAGCKPQVQRGLQGRVCDQGPPLLPGGQQARGEPIPSAQTSVTSLLLWPPV